MRNSASVRSFSDLFTSFRITGLVAIAVLIAASFQGPAANAADDTEFKQSGEVRLRYFNDLNASGRESSEQRADTIARFKYNVAARKGENLQAYLSVIHSSVFGTQNTTSGDYSRVNVPGPSATPPPVENLNAQTTNLLLVNRAWGLWKANESLTFKVGRFGIVVADGAVFSENDWQAVPTAHEGLEVAVDTDLAKVTAYFLKTNELSLPPASEVGAPSFDPERNLYMLTADLKNLPDAVKTANAHFVYVTRDRTDAPTTGTTAATYLNGAQSLQHVGVTLGGEVGGFIYKATGAIQMGVFSRTDIEQQHSAWMIDGLIGYTNPEWANLRLTAGYHTDTGNSAGFNSATSDKNERYQPLYYERHDYSGLMDVLGWGNLSYWETQASFYPAEDFEMGARFYSFYQSTSGDPQGPAFGDRNLGLATGGMSGERSLGSELDAYGSKFYDMGFKVSARMGAFFPGAFLKQGSPARDKPIVQLQFQGGFEF